MAWLNRLPERICSACGELTLNYVAHCLLYCYSNSTHRQKMWSGIWGKFGVDLYIRLAGFEDDTLLSVFLGNYDLIEDLLATDHKEQIYCYIARFAYIMKTVCDRCLS